MAEPAIQIPRPEHYKALLGRPREVRIQMATARYERLLQVARADPNTFIEHCFTDSETGEPLKQQWFHREWHAAANRYKRLRIRAPRAHGKTCQIAIGRALWEIGNNPNLRIKIVCASDGKAMERLFEITDNLEHNPRIREVFPHLRPAQRGEWSKHKIIVARSRRMKDASIEAVGVTSTATGGRCDLLLPDDVCDRRNSLMFPKLRKTVKHSWRSDWTNLLMPTSRVIYIYSPWHRDDLSHQIEAEGIYHAVEHDIPQNLDPIWPDKWGKRELQERLEEIKSIEFNRGFRNVIIDESTSIVNPNWISYFDPREISAENLQFITTYDLAVGEKAGTDYFACVTLAIDPSALMVYVVDAYHCRVTVLKQAALVTADAARYKPFRVALETTAYQDALRQILVATEALPIEPVKPKISKTLRLQAITPWLEQGRVLFSQRLDPTRPGYRTDRGSLLDELLGFPFEEHDDFVDAFTQGMKVAVKYFLGPGATPRKGSLRSKVRVLGGM